MERIRPSFLFVLIVDIKICRLPKHLQNINEVKCSTTVEGAESC